MATIHPRLQTDEFRFALLGSHGEALKKPFEEKWQENANYRYDDLKLSSHRGNHGVCGGFGDLHIVDCDDLARWEELQILPLIPPTFTIESRPGHRQYYLLCKEHFQSGGLFDPDKTELNEAGKPEYVHIGDIKAGAKDGICGGQAVGPGCKHPSGSIYTVVIDGPIAEVSKEQLKSIISRFNTSKKVNTNYQRLEEKATKAKQLKYTEKDPLDSLRVQDILPPTGNVTQSGDELRGDHPVHGSTNGGNYVINTAKNVWHCKRCESGGGAAAAIAVKHGLISCSEAGAGELRGDLFRQVLKIAKERYGMARNGNQGGPKAEEQAGNSEISEEELNAYSLSEGPKFECNLPADHFIQRFMAYGSDISDAYIEYWFAGGLFALAVAADKKIKMVLKQGTIYPNLYVSINGKSSLARKSTVVDKSEAMLCQVLPGMLSALVPTEFSPEAFTEHLSDHNHAPWIRDEAAGVLSIMKRDYMRGFKDSLMQLFDCKPFYRKLRTSQRKGTKTEFRVDDPYLNVLFATTDASLGANTEQNDTLSGFMARFLFFFPQGKKTKWLPLEEGTAANSIFEGVVRDQLSSVAAKMAELPECTAMHFSPDAARYYTEWQRVREEEWTASNDGNAMQIYSRLAPTVTKLGMLFELGSPDFNVSHSIRLEFIKEACQLVDSYFMPTARAVYDLVGANAEKNVIDRTIAYLKKHSGKASKKEIMRDVKIKSADFHEFLDTMIESGVVETKTVKRGGKGRDSLWVFLLDSSNVAKVALVAIVAKVAKVDVIHSKNDPENGEGKNSTLATLATKATFPILATKEQDGGKTAINKPNEDQAGIEQDQTQAKDEHFRDQAAKHTGPAKTSAKDNPGLQRFKAGVQSRSKNTCRLCGQHFEIPLTIGYQGGYICEPCRRDGPPPEPAKDSQGKLAGRRGQA
jgi:hypothetical protein